MKTVALSLIVAVVAAYGVVSLSEPPAAAYDPVSLDIEDRLAVLEGRLARLGSEHDEPVLLGAGNDPAEILRRLAELEAKLDAQARKPAPQRVGPDDPTKTRSPEEVATSKRRDAPRVIDRAERRRIAREKILAQREDLHRLTSPTRGKGFYDLAMNARNIGDHDLEEELFRDVIDVLGRHHKDAREAAYQIGWARRGKGDYAGAREAWLEARDMLPEAHWRHSYARYYAAESSVKAGDKVSAERELEDLVRDIEAAGANDQHGNVLSRSASLLATLRR